MHRYDNSVHQRCETGSHRIILFARFREKWRPPSAKALCNSSASNWPLLSTSIALNHCTVTDALSGVGLGGARIP